jgi:hypothetical protein
MALIDGDELGAELEPDDAHVELRIVDHPEVAPLGLR